MEFTKEAMLQRAIESIQKPKALVFGLTGQDASYMIELLLEKGYEVHGTMRRSSTPNTLNVNKIISRCTYSCRIWISWI